MLIVISGSISGMGEVGAVWGAVYNVAIMLEKQRYI